MNHLLTVVFVTLKLCHVIDWNWFYVILPSLVPLFVAVGIFVYAAIVVLGKK